MLFEIPGYRLMERLSEHGAYQMYSGQRLQDGAAVLLKALKLANPAPQYLVPFWQEYEILRGLDLTGVLKVYGLENYQQRWMIVAEDFGGRPLDQLGISGRMEPEEYLSLALQLAEIVGDLHARQVVHKSISPSNILYNPSTRQAKLANFETASLVSREKAPLKNPYALAESLAYVSPEMTGRMNRSVDYRTDYYSLGATLYELLTRFPPFIGNTPLELVHAHLATLPEPPAARIEPWKASPPAFQILSAILLKLLAKNPQDRYQTPGALRADLHQCVAALHKPHEEGSESRTFIPGQADRGVDLKLSQLVIGREQETEALRQAFLRTAGGPAALVLVSGEAGVGKTTLVNQLIRPVTEHRGFFFYGKFDEDRPLEKYRGLVEVLEEFCRLVLSEPAASLREWRHKLQAALEVNGQLLIDLCPQLERLIGPQPPPEQVDESFARARLHQVVIRFLQTVCKPEHPVVVILDDLQWLNPDGLLLWQSILSSPGIENLLIVGAYRDNEVDRGERVQRMFEEVRAAQRGVTQLRLQNLEWSHIHQLVAAALASDQDDLSELTNLIYRRTEGNPFFSNEFLKKIYSDRLLAFHLDDQTWHWNASRIEGYEIANNVVELFIRRVENLDRETQNVLQLSACIGRRFDTATLLALAGREKASSLASSLWKAVAEGLIQPLDDNYGLLAARTLKGVSAESDEILPSLAELLEGQILLEFQHDRIQQAVLAMLDEGQLKKYYLQIGWLLLQKAERAGDDAVREALFTIIDHLNTASALIEDPAQAIKAAQLNLMASDRARAVGAFETASSYLSTGIQLLSQGSWQHQYTLTLEIYAAAAEVALLNGDLARAEELALLAEENARTPLEKSGLIKTRMDAYMIQTKLDQVIELGMTTIQMLGFDLQVQELPDLLGEQFMQLPEMTDPRALAVSRLVEPMLSAAFIRNDPRFVELDFFFIDLFSRYGNPSTAGFVYIGYAIILLRQSKQIEQACRLGTLALQLIEKGGSSRTLYAVRYLYYAVMHHWMSPAREGLDRLHENIQPAFESGNFQFGIASQHIEGLHSLFVGLPLEEVQSKQAKGLQQLKHLGQVGLTQPLRIWSQVVLKLIGEQLHPPEITGDLFTNEEARGLIRAGQNQSFIFNLYCAQAFLSLVFREPQRAVESSAAAHPFKLSVGGHLILAHHLFIYSLALLSAGPQAIDLAARLEKVDENLDLLRLWASLVPENFLHQLELVEAERARCLELDEQAAESYQRAIHNARKNGYIHESALAAELAAEFYLAREDILVARDYLQTAYYSYLAWGAQAKVDDLVNRYPDWLPPGGDDAKQVSSTPAAEVPPMEEMDSSIDLNTILKASLELAQETNLTQLLRRLMLFLIENAGAQNGSLILWRDDRWVLEVQSSNEPEPDFAFLSIPLEDQNTLAGGPRVPVSIINYVINSRVDLVLQDASASHQFSQDAYIQNKRAKSILCAPLLNQGVLLGVIYLENNLVPGAITTDRLRVVQLISGQAAISIGKAQLYEHLEGLVAERTRELTEANRRLKDEIDERTQVQEALRLSEKRYRTVVENTGTGIVLVDAEGYITFTNEEFAQLAGHPQKVLRNHFNFRDIVVPADAAKIFQFLQTRLENSSQTPKSFEFQLVDSSGVEKAVLSTATLLPGSKITILSLIDISQRKQAQVQLENTLQALRQVEEELTYQNIELSAALSDLEHAHKLIEAERRRYLDLFDFAPDAYLVTSVEGKISEANQAAHNLLGSKDGELTGTTLISLVHPRDRRAYRTGFNNLVALQQDYHVSGNYREWEVRLRQHGGRYFDASMTVTTVPGSQGEPASLRWLVRDISARKKAEQALRQSEERLRSITENAPDFIAELDLGNRFLYVNRPPAGYRREEIIKHSLFDFIPERHHADARDLLALADSSGQLQAAEFNETLPDGTDRWQSVRFAPVIEHGSVGHMVLISSDITERKKMELLLQENEARLRFALDSAQLATFDFNFLTGELVWDLRTKRIWGIPAGESPGYTETLERIHPEDRARAEMALAQAVDPAGTGDLELEFRVVWPDGSVHWLAAKGRMSFAGEGEQRQPARLLGILWDITERKLAEEALRYNEAMLQHVLENLPVGVWIIDKTGRIISGNPEAQKIWSGAKYVGVERYREYKAWRVDTGEQIKPEEWSGTLAVTQGKTSLNEELEIEAFDGTHRIILNSSIPLVTQQDGLVGALVVNQDITRRKQEEEEIERVSEQLSTLLQISQAMASTFDLDRLLMLTIEQLEKLLPYDVAAVLILEQNFLEFRVIRGPSIFDSLSHHKLPLNELALIDRWIEKREELYFPDLKAHEHLFKQIEKISKIPYSQFAPIRSILGVPLIARKDLIGVLILAHFQPDQYPLQSQILARLFANQVAIAIQNAQLYMRAQDMAALHERSRLARELHDSVAQALYSISLFTDATLMAMKTNKPEVVKENLGELIDLSREAMADMRQLIFELRPPDLEEVGLVAALQSRLNAVETRAGMHAVIHAEGTLQFTAEEEDELYWITQEALNNVIKHAHASQVKVQLTGEPGGIRLVIEDDGAGFDPDEVGQSGGQGVRNIHERAEKLGARCWIESAPGQGTRVIIEVKK